MATYSLKFEHAPDTNAAADTSTLRMYCCGVDLGTKVSGPANGAGGVVTNWVEQTIDLTAHMTTVQPKADHYPAWHYTAGNDASHVRKLRIESSGGDVWHDQHGGAAGHATRGVGLDGSGTSSQYNVGDYATLVGSGGRVEHKVAGTDASADYPDWRVEFEIAGDLIAGFTDDAISTLTFQVKQTPVSAYVVLGTRTSGFAGSFVRASGDRAWESRSFPLTGANAPASDPVATQHEVRWQWSAGGDGGNIRNVRLLRRTNVGPGDQFLRSGNGWTGAHTTGVDGSGAAQQPDPATAPPGVFANTTDGWCHHYFLETNPAFRLRLDIAPDDTATGGAGHRTRITCELNGVVVGDLESLPESGNDGVYDWVSRTLDIAAHWIGDGTDVLRWRYYRSVVTAPYSDAGHVRNVEVIDAAGALVEADQFYPLWHGAVTLAGLSGIDSGARVSAIADVCSYVIPPTSGAASGWVTHQFPGDRCSAGGRVKVWTGAAWVEKPVKVWTGAAWVEKPVKVWTGAAWVST